MLPHVSLGPTWFWVPKWDHELKSLDRLKQIYETSVGRNAGLLLNVAPNRDGVIPGPQVRRLREFGQWHKAGFASNLLAQATWIPVPVATNSAAVQVLEARMDGGVLANTVVLREDIARGQFVERVTVEGLSDGKWWELARATTIGRKRILKWPLRRLECLRVTLHETRGELNLGRPVLAESRGNPRDNGRRGRRQGTSLFVARDGSASHRDRDGRIEAPARRSVWFLWREVPGRFVREGCEGRSLNHGFKNVRAKWRLGVAGFRNALCRV